MKYRNLFVLSALAFRLTDAPAAEPHAFTPVVRAGDRVASAPVLIDQVFGPMDSKVREKGRYVLELEGTGVKGQVRVFLRRVDKQEANYRASHAVGELACSVRGIINPQDRPGAVKGIIDPQDRPGAVKGVIEPEDRPRYLNELGFRANAAVHVQSTAPSILLQIKGLDPPSPSQGAVSNCVMKLTLRAAK